MYVVLTPKGVHKGTARRILLPAKICRKQPKQEPGQENGIFDNKVLSRQHAEIFAQDNKVFLKDLNSSNGTYVNGTGPIVEPVQIAEGDIVDFGVDVNDPNDVSRIQHHKLTVQISFPQVYPNGEVAELLPTIDDSLLITDRGPGGNPAANNKSQQSLESMLKLLTSELAKQKEQHEFLNRLNRNLQIITTPPPAASGDEAASKNAQEPPAQGQQQSNSEHNSDEINRLTLELLKAREKIVDLSHANASMASQQAEYEKLKEENAQLEAEVQKLQEETFKAQQQLQNVVTANHSEKIKSLEAKIGTLERASQELENQKQASDVRLQETLGQVTGLQSELTSLQTLFEKSKKEAADTKAQVDKWEGQAKSLATQAGSLETEASKLKKEIASLEAKYKQALVDAEQAQSIAKSASAKTDKVVDTAKVDFKDELVQLRKELKQRKAWVLWAPQSIALVLLLLVVTTVAAPSVHATVAEYTPAVNAAISSFSASLTDMFA